MSTTLLSLTLIAGLGPAPVGPAPAPEADAPPPGETTEPATPEPDDAEAPTSTAEPESAEADAEPAETAPADDFDPAADSLKTESKAEVETPSPAPPPVRRTHSYEDIPIRWRLDFGAAGGSTQVVDDAFLAFTPGRRHLTGFTIDARVDFPFARGRMFAGGGLSYRRAGRSDGIYDDTVQTDLVVHEPLLLGRLSASVVEGVDFYVQIAAGPTIALVGTDTTMPERSARQRTFTGTGEGFGGLALYLPKRVLPRKTASRITGGLDVGLGYGFRGRVDIAPELEQDDDPIPTTSASLGDVALRGLVWRAGLFIRFM